MIEPSDNAKALLHHISTATGLDSSSVILKASSDVEKVLAVTDRTNRYIIINEVKLITEIEEEDNNTLDTLGSQHQYELAADKYAGFALKCLGASLEQILMIANNLEIDETTTHPSQSVRKQQLVVGKAVIDVLKRNK